MSLVSLVHYTWYLIDLQSVLVWVTFINMSTFTLIYYHMYRTLNGHMVQDVGQGTTDGKSKRVLNAYSFNSA